MGERGNIVFLFDPANPGEVARRVYLYTHWRGHLLDEILRKAMNLKETWPEGFGTLTGTVRESCRWYDASYFARVVFNRLTRGDEDGVLSFGIDVDRTLPDYDELHVDTVSKTVRQVRLDPIEGKEGRWEGVAEVTVREWTYQQFADGVFLVELAEAEDLGVEP